MNLGEFKLSLCKLIFKFIIFFFKDLALYELFPFKIRLLWQVFWIQIMDEISEQNYIVFP